jgi:two-component system, cell cycle response regulator DivK
VTSLPSEGRDVGSTRAESLLVLIVDDNESNLRLARDVLRATGLRTLDATSGAQAIALAAEHVPDVILLDLRLPDIDGIDVARELRGDARTAGIPVVAMSALRIEAERERDWLLAAGFAGYVEKPIVVGEFPDQVRSYCVRAGT